MREIKGRSALLAVALCLGLFCFGCAGPKEAPEAAAETEQPAVTPKQEVRTADTLVGFVIPDDGSIDLYTAMHGFLRTAENLGYPAKIYRAALGDQSDAAVEQAKADGCRGLLIWSPAEENAAAIEKAHRLGVPVAVPYHVAQGAGVVANVAADLVGYSEEVARGIAERMVERECKAGKILVYGKNPGEVGAAFTAAIAEYYPQYNVSVFTRTAAGQDAAISELATHILWNRDIKGMFSTDPDGALIAVRAREAATKEFKANGPPEAPKESPAPGKATPTPNPTSTPESTGENVPGATPVPAGLTKSILISVAGVGISDDNIALMQENDIYAFVLEPYYEASAQALMALDRVLQGKSAPAFTRVNMPIVRMDSLDKYQLIYEQVKEWFSLAPAITEE